MARAFSLLIAVGALLCAGPAFAQNATYRCVDAQGRSTYTNVKEEMAGKKCTVVSREVSVVPAQAIPAAPAAKSGSGPAAAAKVDPSVQKSRDETRRKILQSELEGAEKRLADARKNLAEQESIRTGDERNYQRVLERLKPLQEEVERQEQNVAALRRELSGGR